MKNFCFWPYRGTSDEYHADTVVSLQVSGFLFAAEILVIDTVGQQASSAPEKIPDCIDRTYWTANKRFGA